MYRRILVPLDGSALAERALPVAARVARSTGSAVLLVRVITPDFTVFYWPYTDPRQVTLPVGATTADSAAAAERLSAQNYLSQIADSPMLAGLEVERLILPGVAAPTILHTIEEQHADLAVMTSHGRTGLSQWALGSVAQHLARQSTVPVLIIRQPAGTAERLLGEATHAPRVLVTLDGSRVAEAAAAPAADLCVALSEHPGELHLLLVVYRFAAAPDAPEQALLISGARSYLARMAEQLERERAGALRVTWSVITGGDIADTILRVAEHGESHPAAKGNGGYQVIAMSTHGLTGIARWVLGSVADRVLQGTKLPMLVVRPDQITSEASALATD